MRRLRFGLLTSTALALTGMPAVAQDATWKASPGTAVFNTGTNWTPATVPTGVATFDQSTRTSLTFSGTFQFYDVDTLKFNAGAPAYTFATGQNFVSLNGLGIVNNSSNAPTFNVDGQLRFFNSSTAANATINASSGGNVQFSDNSTAGNATVIADGFGAAQFSGNSTGGNARFVANGAGSIDFSNSTGPGGTNKLSAGSLEGSGTFALGANQLTVGSNNLSTTVSGVISGTGGSLVKTGTGTMTLSNANTYTGGTTISGGAVALGHVDASNLYDAIGTGNVTLDGGKLVGAVSGSLAKDVTFNAGKTSTIAAAAGTVLTFGGAPGTGNQPARLIVGANAVVQVGSTTDTGVVRIGASSNINFADVNSTSQLVVAGGTLRDFQDQLWNLTAGVGLTTVNAGATLDFNDSVQQVLVNLNGAGSVTSGAGAASTLTIYSTTGATNTFSGVISGGHPVSFNTTGGAATMILTGDNTYTGGTTICFCGTLQLGNGSTTGSILGDVDNEGTLIFNRSNTYIFTGLISDTGNVIQNGSGTTALAADNTYSGGTTVNAGRLVVGNGGTTGSVVGGVDVAAGAAFGVNRSDTYIVPNAISGAGGFVQLGTGTTIFDTAQAYTGVTTISAGTLQIGNGGVAGSIASTSIVDNATLAINKSNSFALAADVSGTGGLSQIGTGTTSLTGQNTYSGATSVTAGILRAGVAGGFSPNSAFNVGSGGTLNLSGFDQTIGSLAGSGGVLLSTATLTVGNDNTDSTYGGVIQGAGELKKTGTGKLILAGTSTYSGATTVNGGTLSVNGDITRSSGVTVNSGGAIGGTGALPAVVINSGGALAPGNSIGTVTVNGNLTFNAGANYNVEVSPTAADRTNVTGVARIAGSVNASYAPGAYTARQYTILNAAGGVSGTFASLVNTGMPASIRSGLAYDANNVYLNLMLNYAAPGNGLGTNQLNVGNALTGYFDANGGIPTPFASLDSNGLSQSSGEPGAGVQQTILTGAGLFMGSIFNTAFGSAAGGPGQGGAPLGYAAEHDLSPAARNAYAAVTPRDRASSFEGRWSVWAAGYAGDQRVSGDAALGSHDTTSRVYGTTVGAAYRSQADTVLGFALGGLGSNFSVADGLGSGKADAFNAALYGRHAMGAAYVAGAVAYSWQDASTDRTVTAGGTNGVLHASFRPQALIARLEGGWRFVMPAFAVTPYAAAQATAVFMPSFDETATSGTGLFALSYDSRAFTATRAEFGARFDRTMTVAGSALTLKAKAAWVHDWNNDPAATATFQQLAGATFTLNGAKPAADGAVGSVGVDLALAPRWTVGATFDGEFSRTTVGYAGRGSLAYTW